MDELASDELDALLDLTDTPPLRVFPRDDGLGGGSRRTYPPSRGIQSSNRTVGGYR